MGETGERRLAIATAVGANESERFRRAARRVLAGGFVGSVTSVGLTIYIYGVFQDAIIEAFQTDVATYAWTSSLYMVVSGLLSPFVGRSLATRGRPGFSIRRVMLVGAVLIGGGLVLLSRMSSLAAAAAVFVIVVAPGSILMGPLLAQAMITNWFEARRGRALGIVSAGTTVGGMLTPPLAASLIEAFGWRDAMAMLGGLAIAVGVPVVTMLVRDRPEDLGEQVDGSAADAAIDASSAPQAARETRELLRDPALWIVGATFGLIFSAGAISTIFTVPYASELGVPLLGGAAIASMRAGSAAAGKVALGALSDRFGIRPVLYAVIVIEIGLTLLLVRTRDPLLFTILGVSIGFVGGSPLPLKAALVGRIFGRADFAAAMGLVQSLGVPFQLFMVPVAGLLYQAVGTYAAVFALTIPCFLSAAIGLAFIRPAAARSGHATSTTDASAGAS